MLEQKTPDWVDLVQAETGSTINITETLQVAGGFIDRFRYYSKPQRIDSSELPVKQGATALGPAGLVAASIYHQPVGVVLCITPYNFPLTNVAGKIAPALAMGNTCIIKPAPQQVVLCGGVTELVRSAFDTLVDAGYQPEICYFECLHELKLIVDLMYEQGIGGMRYSVSDTAEYGDLTRGPRVVDDHVRETMKQVLDEIQSGVFAEEWVAEAHSGRENFYALEEKGRQHRIEQVGSKLRDMMPWISAGKVSVQDAN